MERDLIIFRRDANGTQNVTSLIERKSRYTVQANNDNRHPAPVMNAIARQLSGLPRDMTRTITFDSRFEFVHCYGELKHQLAMDAYFCDPQAPWQKGAVESNNNRIRRFLPREINLEAVSDADVYAISVILNNMPRQCLGYRTPQEVLDEHLQLTA